MNMFGSNSEWAFGMGIGMWFVWIILIGLVVVLVRVIGCNRCSVSSGQTESPLDILKARYARGEIDDEEFERRRQELDA